jgi:hypothetical protein
MKASCGDRRISSGPSKILAAMAKAISRISPALPAIRRRHAQIARASDPYTRQARTVVDELKRKIPGMSETLMPRRDEWGEEIPNAQALGAAGLTAIYMTKISNDPVNRAMLELGIAPAKVEKKIRNQELTPGRV